MSRLALNIDSARLNDVLHQRLNIYQLMLYRADKNGAEIDAFLHSLVARSRTCDEYEPDPDDIHSIGATGVTIRFEENDWHIEDFISLLIDAERCAAKYEFLTMYDERMAMDGIVNDELNEHHAYWTTEVVDNAFTLAVIHHPWLGHWANRQFLKRYLFWLSVCIDTRIERLACKMNNVLIRLGLDVPVQVKTLNVRFALHHILLQYALGQCTPDEFEYYLRCAYETGFALDQEPDEPAEIPPEECLFDPSKTHFDQTLVPWLVIRNDDMEIDE